MSKSTERPMPLDVKYGDLRVGDVLNSNSVYRDEDDSQGAVCESVERENAVVTATWRITATGEVFTNTTFATTGACLALRGPSVPPRELLWDELALSLHPCLSRERFEECMDAYDRAARNAPDEEPTP